jgi:hypothetical protein
MLSSNCRAMMLLVYQQSADERSLDVGGCRRSSLDGEVARTSIPGAIEVCGLKRIGSLRLHLGGTLAQAPCSLTKALIQSASYPRSASSIDPDRVDRPHEARLAVRWRRAGANSCSGGYQRTACPSGTYANGSIARRIEIPVRRGGRSVSSAGYCSQERLSAPPAPFRCLM